MSAKKIDKNGEHFFFFWGGWLASSLHWFDIKLLEGRKQIGSPFQLLKKQWEIEGLDFDLHVLKQLVHKWGIYWRYAGKSISQKK